MSKVQATLFEITRGEGPTELCGKTETANNWFAINAYLCRWGRTVHGNSDKVDFKVHFADGFVYEGTYLLRSTGPYDLADHMIRLMGCYAGRLKPLHTDDATWERMQRMYEADGTSKEPRRILDTYQIGPFA